MIPIRCEARRRRRHVGAIVSVVLLLFATAAPAAQWATPTVTASHGGGFSWPDAAQIYPFVLAGGDSIARQHTRLAFAYDDRMLHVGVSAEEGDMATVRLGFARGRPERIRDDDSVSVYVRTGGSVHEFTAAADGRIDEVRWTGGVEDPSWSAGATWRIDRPDEWRGVLSIPLEAIGLAKIKAGEHVEFAAVRREAPFDEVSGWPAHQGGKAPPDERGVLVFGSDGGAYTANYMLSRPTPGPSKFGYRLRPLSVKCNAEVLLSDGGEPRVLPITSRKEWTDPGGDGWRVFNYSLPPGAPLKLQTVLYVEGRVFHAGPILPVPLPSLIDQIGDTLARLDGLIGSSSDVALAAAVQAERSSTVALLDAARHALARPPSAQRSNTLIDLTSKADTRAWRSHLLAGRRKAIESRGCTAAGFAVGTTHSIVKLRRWQTELTYGRPIRLRAARRERESAQIVVIPFDRPLANVRLTWTDLHGPDDTKIDRQHMGLHMVGYVKTTAPDYEVEHIGWWPDPLMPLPREGFGVPDHHTQPLWLTVYAPPDARTGQYKAMVTIDAGDAGTLEVPVELEVLDYALPLRGRLRTIFGFDWNSELVGWYGWDTPKFRPHEYKNVPQKWARQIWDMTLSYRIYAGGLYEWLRFPREEDLDFCLERGLNNYQICLPESKTAEDIPHMKKICEDLRRRGLMDIAYVYAWDEGAETNPNIRRMMIEQWSLLKQEIPDLTRADVYGNPTEEVMGVLDVVMPLTPELTHRDRWVHWRKKGHITGAYMCCSPRHPYANFFIDYPAIDQRVVFWQLYDHGVTFFLYYATNIWRQSNRAENRWPDGPWVTASHGNDNGDGHLLYPGKEAVLPSVRLANIRDGIEDYEAFVVLEELTERLDKREHAELIAANEAILSVPDEVAKSLTEYTKEPLELLEWRRRLDEQVLKTKGIME